MVDVSHIGFGGQEGPILKQESFLFIGVSRGGVLTPPLFLDPPFHLRPPSIPTRSHRQM